ncbi:MAG TPA: L-seryl-tRNA(Sec) selenium transferase, partial [Candidatus Dorea intestinavium]|nr:L-seryl-tRNA(Sec) selenium transferase [Candidatus Dorea intestinavium]
IAPQEITTALLEERLRKLSTPIIGRTMNDEVLLDLRTIEESQIKTIVKVMKENQVMNK